MSTEVNNNENNKTGNNSTQREQNRHTESLYSNDSTWPDYDISESMVPPFYTAVMSFVIFIVAIATILNATTVIALLR